MSCPIKNTQTAALLKASNVELEGGYFSTKAFINRFDEWQKDNISEEQVDTNSKNLLRYNTDGSPKLYSNKTGDQLFYYDKNNEKVPIITELFKTLPIEQRSTISSEAVEAITADILLNILGQDSKFLSGEKLTTFDVADEFENIIFQMSILGAPEFITESFRVSKQDYINAIINSLHALGVNYETDAIVQETSVKRKTQDRASAVIKGIFEYVEKTDNNGEVIHSEFMPGFPLYLDASFVWGVVMDHMSDVPFREEGNIPEQYLDHFKKLEAKHPWVKGMHATLSNSTKSIQLAFVAAMNNAKNAFNNTEIEDGIYSTKNAVSNTTGQAYIQKDWSAAIATTFGISNEDVFSANAVELKTDDKLLIIKVSEALSNYKLPLDVIDITNNLKEIHEIVSPLFERLGIPVDEDLTFGAFNMYDYNADIPEGEIFAIEKFKSFTKVLGNNIEGLLKLGNEQYDNEIVLKNSVNFYVKAQESTNDDVSNHMVNVGTNRLYVYSLPSHLQQTVNTWKANPEIIKDLLKDPSAKNSVFLNALLDPKVLMKFSIGIRGIIKDYTNPFLLDNFADSGDIKMGDYAKVDFYNVLRMLGDNHKRVPIFNTQVPADKGKEFQLEGSFFVDTKSVKDAVDKVFFPYAVDEYSNMLRAKDTILRETIRAYKTAPAALKENIDPLLNEEQTNILDVIAEQMQEFKKTNNVERIFDVESLFNVASANLTVVYHTGKGSRIMDTSPDSDTFGTYLGRAFKFELPDTINGIPGIFTPAGLPAIPDANVFAQDMKATLSPIIETAIQAKIDNYANTAVEDFNITIDTVSSELKSFYQNEYGSGAMHMMYHDYVINSLMSKIEYAKLFTGPGQFYKHNGDYIKRVPATYTDGLQIAFEENKRFFKQMTFATEEFRSDLAIDPSLSQEVQKYYYNVDRTDAQGYISISRWKDIMQGIGKFQPRQQAIYAKVVAQNKILEAGGTITAEMKLTDAEVKALSAQPLKGVFFKYDIGGTPVYIKYSQAVLIPEFVNNTPKARQVLEYMEKHGIDEMVADTGVKVGALTPQPLFDKDDNFVAPENPALLTLDNRNWKLQQDLPTKSMKDNKIGVQVQKVIMSTLAFNEDNVAIKEMHDALSELSNEGIKSLMDKYGISEDNMTVNDLEGFYKNLLDDLMSKDVPDNNTIRALKAETHISTMPHLKKPLISNILSNIRKAASNLMTTGGAYIQISDQLVSKVEIEKYGIKMLIDMKTSLKPPRVIERTVRGEVRKVVLPGQVFVPHKVIAKLVPNFEKLSMEELNKLISPEALELIGYRIPTQAKASVDPLQIIGILPKFMGDSIIAYGEITAKTGSDFDIDKMFFIAPELEFEQNIPNRFSESKVQAKVYHGTIFKIKTAFKGDTIFFTPSIDTAAGYVSQKNAAKDVIYKKELEEGSITYDDFSENIIEAYINIRNPLVIKEELTYKELEVKIKEAKAGRYDGVIANKVKDSGGMEKQIVVFSNSQIQKELQNKYSVNLATTGIKGTRNRVFNVYMNALKNADYYEEMMTSIDNDTFKIASLSMIKKAVTTAYDVYGPVEAMKLLYAFKMGKSGVAEAANSSADHTLTQGKRLKYQYQTGSWGNSFFDAQFSESLNKKEFTALKEHLKLFKNSRNETTLSKSEENSLKEIKISGTLSELINAFVDIANEQAYVTRSGWGSMTNAYGMMLLRAGVHPYKVSSILAQPVMVRLMKDISLKEGIVDNTASFEIKEELMAKYKKKLNWTNEDIDKVVLSDVTLPDLLRIVREGVSSTEDHKTQATILAHFMNSTQSIKKYNNFITTAKTDAKGAGGTMAEVFINQNKFTDSYNPVEGEGLINVYRKYFNDAGEPTITYTTYVNNVNFLMDFMDANPMMFNKVSKETLKDFNSLTAQNRGEQSMLNKPASEYLIEQFESYKMGFFQPFHINDGQLSREELFDKVYELRDTKKYTIINRLLREEEGYILDRLANKDAGIKNKLSDSWRLLLADHPEVGDFLVREAYSQSKFLPSPKQFHEVIPFEWFLNKEYPNFIRMSRVSPDSNFLEYLINRPDANIFFKRLNNALPMHVDGIPYEGIPLTESQGMGLIKDSDFLYETPKYALTRNPDEELGRVKVATVKYSVFNEKSKKNVYYRYAVYAPLGVSYAQARKDIKKFYEANGLKTAVITEPIITRQAVEVINLEAEREVKLSKESSSIEGFESKKCKRS